MSTDDIKFMADRPTEYSIFRQYQINHPEDLAIKPKVVESEKEIDFSPKVVVAYRSGEVAEKDLSIAPLIQDAAAISEANEDSTLIFDVNELLRNQKYAGAEHLLGRKLTSTEIRSELVRSILNPEAKSLAQQIEDELDREELKQRLKAKRAVAAGAPVVAVDSVVVAPSAAAPSVSSVPLGESASAVPIRPGRPTPIRTYLDEPLPPSEAVSPANDDDDELDDWSSLGLPPAPGAPRKRPQSPTDSIASTLIAPTVAGDGSSSSSKPRPLALPPSHAKEARLAQAQLANLRALQSEFVKLGGGKRTITKSEKKMFSDLIAASKPMQISGFNMLDDDGKVGQYKDALNMLQAAVDEAQGSYDRYVEKEQMVLQAQRVAADQAEAKEPVDEGAFQPLEGIGLIRRSKKTPASHFVPFGKYVVNLKRLKDDSQFSLKYPHNDTYVKWMQKATLGPLLKEAILSFLEGKPMNTMGLEPQEQSWMQSVWKKSGLVKNNPQESSRLKIKTGGRKTKAELNDRLKIICGEIQAGNDNPALMDELRKLVDSFELQGWLAKEDLFKFRKILAL